MQVFWTVTNAGPADFTGEFHDFVSLSPNAAGFNAAWLYAQFTPNGTIASGHAVNLSGFITPNINLSSNQWIAVVNDGNLGIIGGIGATNFASISTNPVNILLVPLPALQVSFVNVPPTTFAGQSITVNWGVTNAGNGGTGTQHWHDRVWLSANGQIDIDATVLGEVANPTFLNPGDAYISSFTATLPINVQGSYYIVIQTDDGQGGRGTHASE